MRMTDRQVLETKKSYEEKLQTKVECAACDEAGEGHCPTHPAERALDLGTVVDLCDELLRYKALTKKHELPEPREDEASAGVETDDDREKRLLKRFGNLKTALEAIRDEHETAMDGSYKRCGCDLCAMHRQLEDPNTALARVTADYAALAGEYEETCQRFDEGVVNGDSIRTRLTRAIGFFTASPDEMVEVTRRAIGTALKDAEFKTFYDERQADSRQRTLEAIKTNRQVKELNEQVEKLGSELAAVEGLLKAQPRSIDPSVVQDVRERFEKLKKTSGTPE